MFGLIIAGISTIASYIGSVGTAIASIGPSITAAIAQVSATLAEIAAPLVEALKTFAPVIEKVLDLIHLIARVLGIGKPGVESQELGARALEHPKIKLENYETYAEYIDDLFNVDFDLESYAKASDGEKAVYKTMGAAIESKAIAEKLEMNVPVMTFVDATLCGLVATDVVAIFTAMKKSGMTDASLLSACLAGNLTDGNKETIGGIIENCSGKGLEDLQAECQKVLPDNE